MDSSVDLLLFITSESLNDPAGGEGGCINDLHVDVVGTLVCVLGGRSFDPMRAISDGPSLREGGSKHAFFHNVPGT